MTPDAIDIVEEILADADEHGESFEETVDIIVEVLDGLSE